MGGLAKIGRRDDVWTVPSTTLPRPANYLTRRISHSFLKISMSKIKKCIHVELWFRSYSTSHVEFYVSHVEFYVSHVKFNMSNLFSILFDM